MHRTPARSYGMRAHMLLIMHSYCYYYYYYIIIITATDYRGKYSLRKYSNDE